MVSKKLLLFKRKNFLLFVSLCLLFILLNVLLIWIHTKQDRNDATLTQNSDSSDYIRQRIEYQESEVIEETKNWNVFVHKELGFTIKHPNTIAVYSVSDNHVYFTSKEFENYQFSSLPILLQVVNRNNADNDVLRAYKNETLPVQDLKYDQVQINNAIGIKTITGFNSDNNYYLNDEDNSGPVLSVSAGTSPQFNLDLTDYVIMIKTFHFTR